MKENKSNKETEGRVFCVGTRGRNIDVYPLKRYNIRLVKKYLM